MTMEARRRQSIRLRGRSLLALALAPEPPLVEWLAELDARALRSPGFFAGRPVVLDVSAFDPPLGRPGLTQLIADLTERNIRIMALEGADPDSVDAGMPPLLASTKQADSSDRPAAPAMRQRESSLIVEEPVRSGQSIIFPQGDVIVDGSVASGAEIVAGGSIHVYGTLRGRALAGSTGNAKARIFCRKFEAELVAIDGLYKTADDIEGEMRGRPIRAWLDQDAIKMAVFE